MALGPPPAVITHAVKPSDTLQGIAVFHGVSVGVLLALNRLAPTDCIQAHSHLLLPATASALHALCHAPRPATPPLRKSQLLNVPGAPGVPGVFSLAPARRRPAKPTLPALDTTAPDVTTADLIASIDSAVMATLDSIRAASPHPINLPVYSPSSPRLPSLTHLEHLFNSPDVPARTTSSLFSCTHSSSSSLASFLSSSTSASTSSSSSHHSHNAALVTPPKPALIHHEKLGLSSRFLDKINGVASKYKPSASKTIQQQHQQQQQQRWSWGSWSSSNSSNIGSYSEDLRKWLVLDECELRDLSP